MLNVGQILQNRYEITRQVETGGKGAVYEALDRRLNFRVEIKEKRLAGTEEAFRREAQILARLQHPSLPRLLDFFVENGSGWLVTDFIESDDLKSVLRRHGTPFSVVEVLQLMEQLLDVLDYLHSQPTPIIHRRITPSNIKIQHGRAFLLGLDSIKEETETSGLTTNKSLAGYTPNYAPPEQIKGQGISPASDLYALAATVYFLLTAKAPADALERASAVVTDAPDPLIDIRNLRNDVRTNTAQTLMEALSMSAKKRPPSAAAMRQKMFPGTAEKTQAFTVNDLNDSEPETVLRNPQSPPNTPNFAAPPENWQNQSFPAQNQSPAPPNKFYVPLNEPVNTASPYQAKSQQTSGQNVFYQTNSPHSLVAEIPHLESKRKTGSKLPLVILAGVVGVLFIGLIGGGVALWKFAPNLFGKNKPISIFDAPKDKDNADGETAKTAREKALEATVKAESFIQSSRYDDVIKYSKEAIEADPNYAPAYSFYGDANWDSKYENVSSLADMTEVQQSADKIFELTKNPTEAEDFMARAWANLAKEKNEKAAADAGEAIKLKPNYVTALMIRASANSFSAKNDKDALADYAEAIRLSPNYAQAYNNRSSIFLRQKNYKKALEDLNKAIELLPDARYYKYRGDAYLAQRKYDAAFKDYDEALKKNSDYVRAYIGRGDAFYVQRKWQAALDEYKKADDASPKDAFLPNAEGNCYFGLQKWNEAVERYTKAIKIKEEAVFYTNRAGAYRQIRKNDLAKADTEKAKSLAKKK